MRGAPGASVLALGSLLGIHADGHRARPVRAAGQGLPSHSLTPLHCNAVGRPVRPIFRPPTLALGQTQKSQAP